MRRIALFLMLLSLGGGAWAGDRPAFKSHRFDEDWRPFCAQAARTDLLDPLKCIAVAPEILLTLGGELRERVEIYDNPGFGLKQSSDHAFLHRILLHGDLRLGESVRAFVQFGYLEQSGRQNAASPTDIDRLDLMQGFVDVSLPVGAGKATLRGGRQELSFGSQRLVSVRDSPNLRRDFDGGRAFWTRGSYRVDALYVRPVAVGRHAFDDGFNAAEALSGLYVTGPVPGIGPLKGDLYFFDYKRDHAKFATGTANERRRSIGLRLSGRAEAYDWDVEGVYQFGTFGSRDILAWTVASDLGVTAAGLPGGPRFGVKADIATGNHRGGPGAMGTFNALYPKLPYFSDANLIAPANFIDLHPDLQLQLAPGLRGDLGWNILWRETTKDAVYSTPLVAIAGTAGKGNRFMGHQVIAGLDWQATRHILVSSQYVHFFTGNSLRAALGHDVDFGYASVAYRF